MAEDSVARPDGIPAELEQAPGSYVAPPSKTPMYQAINASRYQRQSLIRELEDQTGNRLICYVGGNRGAHYAR